jgi:thioredoxin 1
MPITDITNLSQLEELFTKYQYIVVKFSAEWCDPCKRIHPVYEKHSNDEKYSHVCFLHVDVDESRELCENYSIEKMPTFILFENGVEVSRFAGVKENELMNTLNCCNKE